MDKIMLIDGNSIINRAFYALQGASMLSAGDGLYTNAVFGFLNIYKKYFDEENPSHICVAFDMKAPTFRHEEFEDYKAGRKPMPDELAMQLPIMKEILDAMNVQRYELEGYEADDIIGTLSRISTECGAQCVIITGDRDALQLVNDNVKVRIPRTSKGKTETEDFDPEAVFARYGVKSEQMLDVKALMGDSSDNIPGIKGIGEKTALNLIKKYGSLDNIYINGQLSDKISESPSLITKLTEGYELAQISKRLAKIDKYVPIDKGGCDLTLDIYKIKGFDNERLLELFRKLKFNRLISRFQLETSVNKIENADNESGTADDGVKNKQGILPEDLAVIADKYYKESSLDNELIISYKITENRFSYIGLMNSTNNTPDNIYINTNEEFNHFLEAFKKLLESTNIKKVMYDIKPFIILLSGYNIHLGGAIFDLKIAEYVLNPSSSTHDTDLDNSANKIAEKYKKAKDTISENEQNDLFYNIEMPLIEVLADMEITGFKVDRQELVKMEAELSDKINTIESEIHLLAGEIFNVNSPKQLGAILFEKLKLPAFKKTKTGYSTDSEVLEELAPFYEIAGRVLDYRQYNKLLSTYVNGLLKIADERTGRVHSTFNQTITATGRISSTEPNLQNIPIKTDFGRIIRKAFIPESKNFILLDADYSQIELRILAHMSKDESMLDAFLNDRDIHQATAARVFGLSMDNVDEVSRSKAKAVNFGIVYGISDFGLSRQLRISKKEAKSIIDEYFEKYPGVQSFIEGCVKTAKVQGYVETMFKRRRYIPELESRNYNTRSFGERAAVNTVIQGTAADIIKIAMVKVYNALKEKEMTSRITLQVHDELVVEALCVEADQAEQILKECMEQAALLCVPLKVDIKKGDSWYEAK